MFLGNYEEQISALQNNRTAKCAYVAKVAMLFKQLSCVHALLDFSFKILRSIRHS